MNANDESFDVLVRSLRQRMSFGQTLEEIYEEYVPLGTDESLLFLAWTAAKMLEEDDVR